MLRLLCIPEEDFVVSLSDAIQTSSSESLPSDSLLISACGIGTG